MKYLSMKQESVLPDNTVIKHNLVMKFFVFFSYYKRKTAINNFTKNMAWKIVAGLYVFIKS